MKCLVLLSLTLYCMAIPPVAGNWKERVDSVNEFPVYILLKPNLKPCTKVPTKEQCASACELHSECRSSELCCTAFCGNVCMPLQEMVNGSPENKTSKFGPVLSP